MGKEEGRKARKEGRKEKRNEEGKMKERQWLTQRRAFIVMAQCDSDTCPECFSSKWRLGDPGHLLL